ncbi:MAG: DUF2141 domain-containing protein [Cyanobacteria bacterium J06643_4]
MRLTASFLPASLLPIQLAYSAGLATLFTLTTAGFSASAQELPTSGSLTVQATGLKNDVGQVCFTLFERSEGFPDNPEGVIANQCVPALDAAAETGEADDQPLSVTFEDLPLGSYAVSILHDENEDQQINQGNFGIPTEGFGFSRNPTIQTGAPSFQETAIFVFGNTETEIEMIYF